MDFEIEGDDDDYNFEWGETSKPAAKKNSMFGADAGGYEDETEYNFSYENDRGSKKKYEPFSPVSTHHSAPVSKAAVKNVPAVNSGNALERAQSLMDKYSGKTVSAPTSNFRNQNMRTFSEADISMSSSEEEASEFEMSESMDDTPAGVSALSSFMLHTNILHSLPRTRTNNLLCCIVLYITRLYSHQQKKAGGKKDSKSNTKSKPAGGGGGNKRDINALDSKVPHLFVCLYLHTCSRGFWKIVFPSAHFESVRHIFTLSSILPPFRRTWSSAWARAWTTTTICPNRTKWLHPRAL